jgi:hypothetical protein
MEPLIGMLTDDGFKRTQDLLSQLLAGGWIAKGRAVIKDFGQHLG